MAIELTTNLVPGNSYQLSFYLFGNTSFSSILANVKVGESLTDSTFGIPIDTVVPTPNSWTPIILNFVATQPSKYITVKNIPGSNSWNQIDNFTFSNVTYINSTFTEAKLNLFPNPTTGLISIQTDNSFKFISAIIRNTLGEIIFTTDDSIIDFSHLQTGLYFIEITTDKRKFVTHVLRR